MSQFYNYDNLSPNYIPNNVKVKPVLKEVSDTTSRPLKMYDIQDKFIGYQWNYGDVFAFKFDFIKNVSVPEDAYVYHESAVGPTQNTAGHIGQKAYNTKDICSWTCIAQTESIYVWEQDDIFTYYENGELNITLDPNTDNLVIDIEIFNFRIESVYQTTLNYDDGVEFKLTPQLSSVTFIKGVYYATIKIRNTITNDCVTLINRCLIHVN